MTETARLPTVAVVYGSGSAGPAAIVRAARGLCEILFVCDTAVPGVAAVLAGLRRRNQVCDISGLGPKGPAAVRAEAPDGIVTFSEYCLGLTAELAAALGLPYHDAETVRLLTDKAAQRAALAAAGVDDTATRVVRSTSEVRAAATGIGYPVVVKPRTGAGSRNTVRLEGPDSGLDRLAAAVRAEPADEFVVEKCLLGDPAVAGAGWGDYVSVEAVVDGGVVRTVCVTGKLPLAEPFRETGMFIPAHLDGKTETAVVELAAAAVRALGVQTGVTHTEVKLTPQGPRIIEVNGRAGGHVVDILLRAGCFDLVLAALRLSLGLAPGEPAALHGVSFHYMLLGPVSATELVAVEGLAETRALVGVTGADPLASPGDRLDWRVGNQVLGLVQGQVPDHLALADTVAQIEKNFRSVCRCESEQPTDTVHGAWP